MFSVGRTHKSCWDTKGDQYQCQFQLWSLWNVLSELDLYHAHKMPRNQSQRRTYILIPFLDIFQGCCKRNLQNCVLNWVALTFSNFLELMECLHLNQLASAKCGVLMKLLEILTLNDWTTVSLSKVNVSNPYGICGCSWLCWKSELKQDHICRPIGGRWEPDAGGETQPACQLEWPQEANSPDGDSILGELTDHASEGPPRLTAFAQIIRVNLQLYQERDQTLPESLREHRASFLPGSLLQQLRRNGETWWRGEVIPVATCEMVSWALLWSITEAVEYIILVLEGYCQGDIYAQTKLPGLEPFCKEDPELHRIHQQATGLLELNLCFPILNYMAMQRPRSHYQTITWRSKNTQFSFLSSPDPSLQVMSLFLEGVKIIKPGSIYLPCLICFTLAQVKTFEELVRHIWGTGLLLKDQAYGCVWQAT